MPSTKSSRPGTLRDARGLGIELLGERMVERLAQEPLGVAQRERRHRRRATGSPPSTAASSSAAGTTRLTSPMPQRLATRRGAATSSTSSIALRGPDHAGQRPGAAAVGRQADLAIGVLKYASSDAIARSQAHMSDNAETGAGAMDARDDGLRQSDQQLERRVHRHDEILEAGRALGGRQRAERREHADVAARHEMGTRAAQHDGAYRRVVRNRRSGGRAVRSPSADQAR